MKQRNILLVMEQILEVIPESYIYKQFVKDGFASIPPTVHYLPPENRQVAWQRLHTLLSAWLPDPADPKAPEWTRDISDIITDKKGGTLQCKS